MTDMQYFVSIEDNAYCRWQAELLIESFKYHGLQNQLVIGIADNEKPDIDAFKKNLDAHERKFKHKSVGKTFNKTRSLLLALEKGFLKKPFTLLHPDMLLLTPIEVKSQSIVYDLNPSYVDGLKAILSDKLAELMRYQRYDWFSWIPLGDTMIFNQDVRYEFFISVHQELINLTKRFGEGLKLERAAWLLTIYKNIIFNEESTLTITGESLEQNFSAHKLFRNIIHYRDGIIPEFSKHNYKYDPPNFMALHSLNPMDCIFENNFTTSTHFANQLIENYR